MKREFKKSGVFGRWRSDPLKTLKASHRGRRESGERDARVALGGSLGHRFCKGNRVRLRRRCFGRGLSSAPRARYLTEFLRDALFCFFPLPWFSSSALSIPYNGAILGAARVPPFRVRAALQQWVPLWCPAKIVSTAPSAARGAFIS